MIMEHSFKETLLTVLGLSLYYGTKPILQNVNVKVLNVTRPNMNQGQIVALVGPSGCGKTQLFRCMAGLIQPTKGAVLLRDSTLPVKAGEVGVVQQAYPLLQHRTVMGNLLISKKATKTKAMELLTRFGLADKANSYPIELSGGQRQRIAIIQQLLMDNYFLLMDEPFSGLDILAKAEVCDIIREVTLIHEDNTVVFTTHDIDTAVSLADTVLVMGRTYDDKGISLGSSIVKSYDLISKCIAWHDDNHKSPQFLEVVNEIKELFKTL
jgi:ABC-type nitrate/sulfonate/bicarbonate transport system ATPase subunit